MSDYNTQTVVQLRELLKSRGLPPQGLKNELIERLVKDDGDKAGEATGEKEGEQKEELQEGAQEEIEQHKNEAGEHDKQEEKQDGNGVGSDGNDDSEERAVTAEDAAAPTEETPQEKKDYKQMAIDLLNKKLHRARKFGQDQEQVDSLQKLLGRIEKFGLDPNMPIAQEVGMVPLRVQGPRPKSSGSKKSKKISKKSHRRN